MMTEKRLIEIEARIAKVEKKTEGPWAWEATGDKDNGWTLGEACDANGKALRGQMDDTDSIGDVAEVCSGEGYGGLAVPDFIAHAREDLPALVAEVRRLRKLTEELTGKAVTKR
mgnify:CR=1 FL=1